MKHTNHGAVVRKVWQPNGDHVMYWPYAFRYEDVEWVKQLDREQSHQDRPMKEERSWQSSRRPRDRRG